MRFNSICVIVPAFNEEGSIAKVITEIKKVSRKVTVVVVNDGSTDNTQKEAERTNSVVINLPVNLGIGGSVQTGLKYAHENGYNLAAQIDGDGQHDPSSLPDLVSHLNGKIDMVLGSRFIKKTNYKTPILRMTGIKLFSYLIFLTCGKKVYDTTSGYRVFGKKAIDYFSENYPQDFPEPKSLVSFLKSGYRIKEVPAKMRQRQTGISSVANIYQAFYLMTAIAIAILIESFKVKSKNERSTSRANKP